MKKLLILMIIIISAALAASAQNDVTADTVKKHEIELSIGGGLSHSLFTGIELADIDFAREKFFNGEHRIDLANYLSINIPFSFFYHFNKKFGLGFNYSIQTGFLFHITYFSLNPNLGFSINNKISISNKIGKDIDKDSFLSEYGINLMTLFNANAIDKSFSYNNFIFGPSFLFGKESIYKNFSYMFGGTFDILINGEKIFYNRIPHIVVITHRVDLLLCFGVEFRWRFCYLKEVK